ncbi:MAG: hypothetical protein D6730_14160 [Bacteroidetes bacterium]|nr:MAG: hypothetical protein D6730_14160 [Bacteroidota bacterium]
MENRPYIGLSVAVDSRKQRSELTKRLLQCFEAWYELFEPTAVSLQVSSSHPEEARLSRKFVFTQPGGPGPYYPHAERCQRAGLNPYLLWELIDDCAHAHCLEAGELVPPGLCFHLYVQQAKSRVFEPHAAQNGRLPLYDGDELLLLPVVQTAHTTYLPSGEGTLMPFTVELWGTGQELELEIFLNWSAFNEAHTASFLALAKMVDGLLAHGWSMSGESSWQGRDAQACISARQGTGLSGLHAGQFTPDGLLVG